MYEKDDSARVAAAMGLSLEEIPDDIIEVWDMNWETFTLFHSLSTQWRVGMGGATGLDYTAVAATADMIGIEKKELQFMFPDIQVMENEALITMGENKEDDNNS